MRRIKTLRTGVALAVLALFATNVSAQFMGSYDPSNWTFVTNTVGGDGYVDVTGAPGSIILAGSDAGVYCCDGMESYEITVCATGTITFDWSHVNPDLDDAYYYVNGVETLITYPTATGSSSVPVNAGDVFGFRVKNYDDCCGRGVLTISNFNAPACCNSGFANQFDPSNWTLGQFSPPSDGYVNTVGAPASIELGGDDDNSGACCSEYTNYSITMPYSATISFDYNHVNPDIDDAYYAINGAATLISTGGTGSIGPLSLCQGDVFEFQVQTIDDCCGRGVLTISNFTVCDNFAAPTLPTLSGTTTICEGDTTVLSVASGVLNSATDWEWYSGSCGGTVVGTGTSISVNPTTTTDYFVRGTGPCLTPGTCASITVNVNAMPTVTATATSNTVCAGDTIALVGGGAVSYSWDNGVTDLVPFVPTATTLYTVTGTDGNGCMNTDTTTVFVNALPTVVAMASADTICAGDTVTLSGSGAMTYVWDNGVTDGVPFVPTATTLYTVYGTDANGCSDMDTKTILVNALPTVVANASSTTVCNGDSVTLTGSGATTYSWDNGVTDGVSFVPTATSTYVVTGTDANGCDNSDSIAVIVNPLPTVDAGTSQTVCDSVQVTLSGSGAVTYSWDNGITNGVPFTQSIGTVVYTVTGTDANGCSNTDTVSVTVQDCSGLDELDANSTIALYPNPNNGAFSITISNALFSEITIEVLDMNGKVVYESVESNSSDQFTANIELPMIEVGTYFVHLTADGKTSVKKVIIE